MKAEEILDIAAKSGSKVVFQITGEELMNVLRLIASDTGKGANMLKTVEREQTYAVMCARLRTFYDEGKISVRTYSGLVRCGIETLGALCQTSPRELQRRLRNFGHISCEEAKDLLKANGLDFGFNVKQYGYPSIAWVERRHQ